jgi:hypothetical protein
MKTNAPRSAVIAGYTMAYEGNLKFGCWALSYINANLRATGVLPDDRPDITERSGGLWSRCIAAGVTPEEFAAEGMNRLEARLGGTPFEFVDLT